MGTVAAIMAPALFGDGAGGFLCHDSPEPVHTIAVTKRFVSQPCCILCTQQGCDSKIKQSYRSPHLIDDALLLLQIGTDQNLYRLRDSLGKRLGDSPEVLSCPAAKGMQR